MIAYKYNKLGLYIGEISCQKNPMVKDEYFLPANSTLIAPPEKEGVKVPKWNGESWELIEDHRKHLNDKGDYEGGTPYWMPEDDWRSEARYMSELGPLPEGALLEKPEKPQSETDREKAEQEISKAKAYLASTDYAVIKCAESGLDIETEYPGLKAERQSKRDLINSYEEKLKEMN